MKKSFLFFIILLFVMVSAALADWTTIITVTGEVPSTPTQWQIGFGETTPAFFALYPPPPPEYGCYAGLYVVQEGQQWLGPYGVAYFEEAPTTSRIEWVLEIDPNGNIMPPIARTVTISWDPATLSATGKFSVVEYYTSAVVVADMRLQTSFQATGTENRYYKIIYHAKAAPISTSIYPNPFNPTTAISFSLPEPANVILTVYDITGREVSSLVDGYYSAGEHAVTFDGSALSSGIYFYHIMAGDYAATQKMMLVK